MKPFDAQGAFQPAAEGKQLRRVAVRSAGITLLGQGAAFVLRLGSTMVLARLLTPRDFGIMAMVTTVSLLFSSFGLNGFTELIMQREEITNSLASNLFWIDLGLGLLLTTAFAGSAPVLAAFYHNAYVAKVAALLSLQIGIGCAGWIHMGLLQRAMRFRAIAFINLIAQMFLVVVSIVLAMAGWHYWALAWGAIAYSATVAAGAWLMCRWVPSWPRSASGTGSGLRFAMNVYSHFAFSYFTGNTDNLLVGWRYGARWLGFYKKAYDLFVLPQNQLLSPLSAVAVSTLSRAGQDREQFRRYFLRLLSVLALVGMGVGGDFALTGRDLIRFLLGPGWAEAGRIFSLFGPGVGIMLLYQTHGWIHLSIGRPERWFRWGLVEFACTVSLFLVALHWGPAGIALAWTTSYFLLMFPGFWYAGKPIGLPVAAMLTAIWKFFAASLLAGVTTVLILRVHPFFAASTGASAAFMRAVLASSVFCSLYLIAVALLHRGFRPITDTLSLLRDFLPDRPGIRAASSGAIAM